MRNAQLQELLHKYHEYKRGNYEFTPINSRYDIIRAVENKKTFILPRKRPYWFIMAIVGFSMAGFSGGFVLFELFFNRGPKIPFNFLMPVIIYFFGAIVAGIIGILVFNKVKNYFIVFGPDGIAYNTWKMKFSEWGGVLEIIMDKELVPGQYGSSGWIDVIKIFFRDKTRAKIKIREFNHKEFLTQQLIYKTLQIYKEKKMDANQESSFSMEPKPVTDLI